MFPLLKKDGLVTQYIVLTLLWNYLIGYNPFKLRAGSFVKLLSIVSSSTAQISIRMFVESFSDTERKSLDTFVFSFLLFPPFSFPTTFQTSYTTILSLHFLELITTPPSHLPDLFPVLNLTMSCGVFGLAWLWGGKRLGQESWAIGGF